MNYDLTSLNEQQLAALKEIDGAILVTAGAGSGKTRLLTHRVAYLLQRGVSPYRILAITFTNKATREMQERISNMVSDGDKIWISTFHSMCAKILRSDIDRLGYKKSFTIYDEVDSEKVIKNVLSSLNMPEDRWKKEVQFHLSNWKNNIISLGEYESACSAIDGIHKIVLAIDEYEKTLRKNNALDFDDLLIKTYRLFSECEEVKDYYADRFEYILVDEFQDTNTVQYALLKQLSSIHGNIFVVGDEDQCIYSWRGANFKNIFSFKNDYPNVKIFKLERNYRSTSKILNKANELIAHNSSRLVKKLWTDKEGGDEPQIYNAVDERDEAVFVASTIERMLRKGAKPSDFAILMRMNALSRNLEEALLSYNIPHKIYGGFKFYERAEIKNVVAYLRLFVNPDDDVAFLKIINFPRRGIGETSIKKLVDFAGGQPILQALNEDMAFLEPSLKNKLDSFMTIYNGLKNLNLPLGDYVSEIITKFGLREAYDKKTDEGYEKLMNISSFEAGVKEFARLNPEASLSDYLESITLVSDSDEIDDNGCVTIASVHAVKGLEFKNVFIIGVEEGIFPISRATTIDEMEEERRLMYVALTRAEERVFITHCSKRFLYGKSSYELPSRFCKELGFYKSVKRVVETPVFVGGNLQGKSYSTPLFDKSAIFGSHEESEPLHDVKKYKVGQIVEHARFGEGVIKSISDDGLVADIQFEKVGVKSLMLELAPLEIKEG